MHNTPCVTIQTIASQNGTLYFGLALAGFVSFVSLVVYSEVKYFSVTSLAVDTP